MSRTTPATAAAPTATGTEFLLPSGERAVADSRVSVVRGDASVDATVGASTGAAADADGMSVGGGVAARACSFASRSC